MYFSGSASVSLQLVDSRRAFVLKIKALSEAGLRIRKSPAEVIATLLVRSSLASPGSRRVSRPS